LDREEARLQIFEANIAGKKGTRGKLKKRIDGSAFGIHCSYPGRSYNGHLFAAVFPDAFEQGCFSCSGLPGQENILIGLYNKG
jgi:hypothetical protein